MRFYKPEAVLGATRTVGVAHRGVAAIRGFTEEWMGAYDELEMVLEEQVSLGNGVGFGVISQRARPVGVNGYVQQRGGWVVTLVDGLIASQTVYPEDDIEEGRAAAERLAKDRG